MSRSWGGLGTMVVLAGLALTLATPLLAQEESPSGDEIAIRTLLEAQVRAWNAGDIEGFMGAYEPSEEVLFASGGDLTRGWRKTLERYRVRYDSPEKMGHLAFELLQIDLLGSAHAKVLGRWSLERDADRPHGLFTLILARREDSWRIIHDHTSSACE